MNCSDFAELYKIGTIDTHDVSIYIGTEIETEIVNPIFYVVCDYTKEVLARVKIKDLFYEHVKELNGFFIDDFKNWAVSDYAKNKKVTNLEVMLLIWESINFDKATLSLSDIEWVDVNYDRLFLNAK